jgi:small conductance mechanosensitive channel
MLSLLLQSDPASPDSSSTLDTAQIWSMVERYGLPALTALLVLFATLLAGSWVRRVTSRACERAKLEPTLARFFGGLARWAVLLVGALLILGEFGIQTASFAVVLGAAGFAVGMALQGTLGNFAAGVMLLVFRPFKIGDAVTVAGVSGKVDAIDLFSTTIDTADNRRLIVPNGVVYGATIENATYHPIRRAEILILTDAARLDPSRATLEAAARTVPGRLDNPPPEVALVGISGFAAQWAVRVWIPTDQLLACQDALLQVSRQAVDAASLGPPLPPPIIVR